MSRLLYSITTALVRLHESGLVAMVGNGGLESVLDVVGCDCGSV